MPAVPGRREGSGMRWLSLSPRFRGSSRRHGNRERRSPDALPGEPGLFTAGSAAFLRARPLLPRVRGRIPGLRPRDLHHWVRGGSQRPFVPHHSAVLVSGAARLPHHSPFAPHHSPFLVTHSPLMPRDSGERGAVPVGGGNDVPLFPCVALGEPNDAGAFPCDAGGGCRVAGARGNVAGVRGSGAGVRGSGAGALPCVAGPVPVGAGAVPVGAGARAGARARRARRMDRLPGSPAVFAAFRCGPGGGSDSGPSRGECLGRGGFCARNVAREMLVRRLRA